MAGCSQAEPVVDCEFPASEKAYTLLHDDLYTDQGGNLYHRTIDVSADDQRQFAYRDYVWVDTVIDDLDIILSSKRKLTAWTKCLILIKNR